MFQRMLFHLACVFALAWPAFLNGQPFYFPDTTAYTRAADSAAYIFSGHRVRTEWTDHYRTSLDPARRVRDPGHHVSAHANDLGSDSVMAGRSPYFGALLWLSYLFSRFWLFVIGQAVISYALIRTSLRLFGFARPPIIAACVGLLSLLTSLPFFTALLMPDLLAGFAILAFLLLAIDRGRLGRGERWGLLALIFISVIAHITHILVIATLAVLLFVWAMARRWPRDRFAPLISASAMILVGGILSVMISSAVIEQVFGRRPLLAPLLTARFLADGPGLDYIKRHCPQVRFAACAYRDRSDLSAGGFLWSIDPKEGGYMLADTVTRRALSMQDKAFALAVLSVHPIAQGGQILRNGWLQFITFESDITNYRCTGQPRCWSSLPERERIALLASLGGRDLWPQRLINVTQYGAVAIALLFILAWLAAEARKGGDDVEELLLWLALLLAAMAVNALLGGGVSEPQPRYQARVIWLLPFLAMIVGLCWNRRRRVRNAGG